MKELTIEEKAKRYDEAVEKLREIIMDNKPVTPKEIAEYLFPELNDDERIKKWIKKELESKYVVDNIVNNVMADKAFAWLEKQGEHANFRKNIQVGDKVTRNKDGVLVNLSQLKRVAKKNEKQGEQKSNWSEEDEKKLLCICAWIKDYPRIADFTDEMYTVANNYVAWLKSLKERNAWKPSEKQMEALRIARDRNDRIGFYLSQLYDDLKKLM